MSSLPRSLQEVGKEVADYYAKAGPAETPPYILYVYPPKDEFPVRRELADLRLWLQARGVHCVAVSLAELFWQAVEQAGYLDQVCANLEEGPGGEEALRELHTSINQMLTGPPSLADRVLEALQRHTGNSAAFLYRAGALYPSYRTSALLDDLRERLSVPVVLLYPGRMVGTFGLSFMGHCEPAHGYRAKIIPREAP
jgi:hypothetical protein